MSFTSLKSLILLVAYIAVCFFCLKTQNYFAISILSAGTAFLVAAMIGASRDWQHPTKTFAIMAIVLFLIDANSEVSLSRMVASFFVYQFLEGGPNSTDRIPSNFSIGTYSFQAYMPGREARNALVFRFLGSIVVSYLTTAFFETRSRNQKQLVEHSRAPSKR